MAKIDDVTRGEFDALLREVRQLRYATPLNGASIGSGGLRVYGGGVITIENGGLRVTGTAEIIGALVASGTITFTGPVNITGELIVTGPTHLNGEMEIAGDTSVVGDFDVSGPMTTTGTLSVEGVTTLQNDLNIVGGGKIKAGNVNITPSASNGGIEFVSGGGIGGNAGAVVVKGTSNAGLIADTQTSIFAGASSLDVKTDGVYVTLPLTSQPANLYADSNGKLYKSTA